MCIGFAAVREAAWDSAYDRVKAAPPAVAALCFGNEWWLRGVQDAALPAAAAPAAAAAAAPPTTSVLGAALAASLDDSAAAVTQRGVEAEIAALRASLEAESARGESAPPADGEPSAADRAALGAALAEFAQEVNQLSTECWRGGARPPPECVAVTLPDLATAAAFMTAWVSEMMAALGVAEARKRFAAVDAVAEAAQVRRRVP